MKYFKEWLLYILILLFIIRLFIFRLPIEYIIFYQIVVIMVLIGTIYIEICKENSSSFKAFNEVLDLKGINVLPSLFCLYLLYLHFIHKYLTFAQVGIYGIALLITIRYVLARYRITEKNTADRGFSLGIATSALLLLGVFRATTYNYGKAELGSIFSKNEFTAIYYADVEGPYFEGKAQVLIYVNGFQTIGDHYPTDDYIGESYASSNYANIRIVSIYDDKKEIIKFKDCRTLEDQEALCYDENDGEWRIEISDEKVE